MYPTKLLENRPHKPEFHSAFEGPLPEQRTTPLFSEHECGNIEMNAILSGMHLILFPLLFEPQVEKDHCPKRNFIPRALCMHSFLECDRLSETL